MRKRQFVNMAKRGSHEVLELIDKYHRLPWKAVSGL